MSGGSLNYLCYKETEDLLSQSSIEDMERVADELLKRGYEDIALDVRRLIEYCLMARNRITVLKEQLQDVFHAVEWRIDGDYVEKTFIEELEKYRKK
jgi:hypothetical protein